MWTSLSPSSKLLEPCSNLAACYATAPVHSCVETRAATQNVPLRSKAQCVYPGRLSSAFPVLEHSSGQALAYTLLDLKEGGREGEREREIAQADLQRPFS